MASVLDKASDPSSTRKDFLPTQMANNEVVNIGGIVSLFIGIAHIRKRTCFGTVETL